MSAAWCSSSAEGTTGLQRTGVSDAITCPCPLTWNIPIACPTSCWTRSPGILTLPQPQRSMRSVMVIGLPPTALARPQKSPEISCSSKTLIHPARSGRAAVPSSMIARTCRLKNTERRRGYLGGPRREHPAMPGAASRRWSGGRTASACSSEIAGTSDWAYRRTSGELVEERLAERSSGRHDVDTRVASPRETDHGFARAVAIGGDRDAKVGVGTMADVSVKPPVTSVVAFAMSFRRGRQQSALRSNSSRFPKHSRAVVAAAGLVASDW